MACRTKSLVEVAVCLDYFFHLFKNAVWDPDADNGFAFFSGH